MKRFFATLLAALMLVSMIPVSVSALEPTYTLSTKEALLEFAADVKNGNTFAGAIVKLGANIDLAGVDWTMIGTYGKPFSGEFDGAGYTISNMTDAANSDHKGLFAHLNNAYVHDLTLKDVKFSGTLDASMYAGALVGEAESKNVIKNVAVDGITYEVTAKGGSLGGLVGYTYDSNYINCSVKDVVYQITSTGNVNMGGMVGQGRGVGTFSTAYGNTNTYSYDNCSVENVTVTVAGKSTVGGFLGCDGYNHWANYGKDCTVTGLNVTCAADDAQYTVGGFMGSNYGANYGKDYAFENCSTVGQINAVGNTNAASGFGGFVGWIGGRPTSIGNCTANVDINVGAGDVGGFVAETQQYFAHAYAFDGCAAEGDVSTDDGVAGGFIASIQHGGDGNALNVSISNSSASGSVTGTTASGFAGVVNDNKNSTHTGGTVTITDSIATLAPVTGDKVSNFVTKTEGMADDVVSHAGEVVTPNDMLTGEKDNIEVTDDNQPLKITWKHEDGETLATTYILPGEIPEYDGETPTKDSDDEYNYVFAGWTPGVSEVSGDTTYTAKFEAVKIEEETPVRDSFLPFIVTGVTQIKVIDAETEASLEGATFELYRISATGSRKLHGTYTSNTTGRITARTLSPRFTYELVMTAAPEGYDLLEAPVIFKVQYNRPLQQVVPVTKTVVEEAPVETPAA